MAEVTLTGFMEEAFSPIFYLLPYLPDPQPSFVFLLSCSLFPLPLPVLEGSFTVLLIESKQLSHRHLHWLPLPLCWERALHDTTQAALTCA